MKKQWIVAFGTEKIYLTNEEAEFYMGELRKGQHVVMLRSGKILTDKFLYMIPLEVKEESDLLEVGKWECDFGEWHSKGYECTCGNEYEYLEDGTVRVNKTNKPVKV